MNSADTSPTPPTPSSGAAVPADGGDLAVPSDPSPRPAVHTHTAGPAVLDAPDPATGTPAAPAVP